MKNRALILDFGSQYTQLIARRIREIGVYTEIVPFSIATERIREFSPGALVLSGGPSSVYTRNAPLIDAKILDLGIPILGICYGMQLIAHLSGMRVTPAKEREFGLSRLNLSSRSRLLNRISSPMTVWMSHGDKIAQLPPDFEITGTTENTEIAVIESDARRLYGVQFHPEVAHTTEGRRVLENFLFNISGLKADWNMGNFIADTIARVRRTVKNGRVILGLSGGVDSTVLAVLLKRAVGEQLIPVFVDTGLLRKNEFNDLMSRFRDQLKLDVHGIDASELFLERLRQVRSPERKRKIIGKTFIDVFASIEKDVGPADFFAQGTLYPDVIESVSVNGPAAKIKSHHNVGGLPKTLKWQLIEPLRELFKDEVRLIGRELGLDETWLRRHPFPGPGLAVRIIGAVNRERVRRLQEADAILIEELHNRNIYDDIWQAFAVLLPIRSVGVMGDVRTYENVAVLRMVRSVDGMTADSYPAEHAFLSATADRIVNEVKGINRVAYDLTSKPPGTIEWE